MITPTLIALDKLHSLVDRKITTSLANNSLLFTLELPNKGQRLTLWVHSPWRLLLDAKVVGESCEFFDGKNFPKKSSWMEWDRWSLGFANWIPGSITSVSVGLITPDLRLVFQSGHILEAFSSEQGQANWSFSGSSGEVFVSAMSLRTKI